MRAWVVLLALAAFVMATAVPATAKVPKVPKGWIGMLADDPVFDEDVSLGRELRAMRRAGVQTLRVPFYGARAQPSETGPLGLAHEDEIVLSAAKARLRVLPTVLTVPNWGRETNSELFSGPTAKGLDFYARYVRALVARYGPKGTLWTEHPEVIAMPVRKWQLWNEPLTRAFWFEGSRNAAYIALLRAATPAIRAADPRAKVVLGGLVSGTGLRTVYQQGARELFDEVAIHPFTFKVSNVLRLVGGARQAMIENGDRAKPILLTEVAWPSAYKKVPNRSSYGFEVTEREQATKVRSAFRQLARYRKRLKISGVVWASWLSIDRGTFVFNYSGLRRLTPGKRVVNKPGFFAFRKVARELTK